MSLAMNMHKNYDAIISGSAAMTVHFAKAFNYDEKYFLNYGLPRIDYLLKEKDNLCKKIYKEYPKLRKKPVVMYAPTFRTDKKNNLVKLINIVARYTNNTRVYIYILSSTFKSIIPVFSIFSFSAR